jgi:hypothetical protein
MRDGKALLHRQCDDEGREGKASDDERSHRGIQYLRVLGGKFEQEFSHGN